MLRWLRQRSSPSFISACSSRNIGAAKHNGGIDPRVCFDAEFHPNRPAEQ
ncbi:hypothetical protein ABH926_008566 [Catenulispora sp. GP43]